MCIRDRSVISGLVAADGACRSCLPRHAADAAVILGRPVAGVILQILRELRSADARQPAAYIIGVSPVSYTHLDVYKRQLLNP